MCLPVDLVLYVVLYSFENHYHLLNQIFPQTYQTHPIHITHIYTDTYVYTYTCIASVSNWGIAIRTSRMDDSVNITSNIPSTSCIIHTYTIYICTHVLIVWIITTIPRYHN